MWGERLTHTVIHTGKCTESTRNRRAGGCVSRPVVLLGLLYMTCSMNTPIVSAACFCICRVAWVYVRRVNPAS